MATRCVLAAGDLLQAGTVVVLDSEVDGLTPSWVAALAASVRDSQVDLVAPVYRRHAAEGSLVTQLVRPLVRAVYGRHLREPLLAEFGCSGRLAAKCTHGWLGRNAGAARHQPLDHGRGPARRLHGAAGRSRFAPPSAGAASKASLPDVFRQVVGSAFATIEAHSALLEHRARDGRRAAGGRAADTRRCRPAAQLRRGAPGGVVRPRRRGDRRDPAAHSFPAHAGRGERRQPRHAAAASRRRCGPPRSPSSWWPTTTA